MTSSESVGISPTLHEPHHGPGGRPPRATARMHWAAWGVLVFALSLFLVQTFTAIPQDSATFDEQYHLAAGYAYLRTGDYRLASNHPPLMGMIGGLGLLTKSDITLPLDDPAWETANRYRFSDLFLWERTTRGPEYLIASRRVMVVTGLLLLVALFLFARGALGTPAAGLVALLAVFDPNLLFHTRLVTTDFGVTLFLLLAVWALWVWLEHGSIAALIAGGAAAGLAMGAKYTGVLIWPAAALILLLYPMDAHTRRAGLRRRLLGFALLLLIGLATLWALYRFDVGPVSQLPEWLHLPAPYYWENLLRSFTDIVAQEDAKLFFLMGERSESGFWNYFPVALSVKTPLPTLLLAVTGTVLMVWSPDRRRQVIFWAAPLLFLLLGLTGYLTIGYRHMLPALPFVLLLAGNVARWADAATGRKRTVAFAAQIGCIVWLAVGTLRIWPHHGSYFNELAGHWTNWSNILVDSNLDWGQDLPALARAVDELAIEELNLAYFGNAVPERYGLSYRPLPGFLRFVEGTELNAFNPLDPAPGWYAISASSLQLGLQQPGTEDLYAFFRDRTPDSRAGYSIYLYHVEENPAGVDRAVFVGAPAWQAQADALTGRDGARLQVKWLADGAAQIYPLGEGFVVPDAALQADNADFAGVFTLLGAEVDPAAFHAGAQVPVSLIWQVGGASMPMPSPTRGAALSAFLHLTDPETEEIVAQFDGWPTALRGLEQRDVIVQPAQLQLPDSLPAGAYELRVGLYSPQDWQRLPVQVGESTADYVVLAVVDVASP